MIHGHTRGVLPHTGARPSRGPSGRRLRTAGSGVTLKVSMPTERNRGATRPLPMLPYVAVVAMLLAAILLRERAEPALTQPVAVERHLQTELEARVGAIAEWQRARRAAVERIADAPLLRRQLRDALAGDWAPLERSLARLCVDLEGCALRKRDGAPVASYQGHGAPPGLVAGAARGRTVQSQLVAIDAQGRVDPGARDARYAVFFATPIVENGAVLAVLSAHVLPEEELGMLLAQRPPGRTGETYAVDPRGYMVTRSRFDDRSRGRAGATRVFSEPAAWLTSASSTDAPAVAALRASGTNVGGYMDYRGVRVVGAWRWLADLGAGVITEMDVVEAYRADAFE